MKNIRVREGRRLALPPSVVREPSERDLAGLAHFNNVVGLRSVDIRSRP
jgi:hypothetical protein